MTMNRIIVGKYNKEMTHGNEEITSEHKRILDKIQLYFNKDIYLNYSNSEYSDKVNSESIITVNMWSAEKNSDMVLPEEDTAFGFKYCADGVYVPNERYLTVGDTVPLLQFKDNNFYFLYDTCEYNSEDELKLMDKLVNDMLILIAGSKENVDLAISNNVRIEKEKKTKAFIKRLSNRDRENKNKRRDELERKKNDMESYRKEIRKLCTQIQIEEEVLMANEGALNNLEETLNKELQVMIANKKINDVEIDDNGFIIVNTETIFSNVLGRDKVARRYRFGEYKINIDVSNGSVKFYNKNKSDLRYSAWGSKCHHPHVSENGQACLGSASSLIMDCVDRYQWGILADVLVNYLESVNVEDTAGKNFYNWDEVDKEGNKLEEQYDGSY